MKKIFTLLISTTLLTSAFAQHNKYDRGYDKDVSVKNNWNKNDDGDRRERDMQIMQIKRAYDHKIEKVRNKIFMSRFKKQRTIALLEAKRDKEIQMVYEKFNNRHGHYNNNRQGNRW